jgi:hypothetical protein
MNKKHLRAIDIEAFAWATLVPDAHISSRPVAVGIQHIPLPEGRASAIRRYAVLAARLMGAVIASALCLLTVPGVLACAVATISAIAPGLTRPTRPISFDALPAPVEMGSLPTPETEGALRPPQPSYP